MSNFIVETSDDSFEKDVLKIEGYVLVDFWAQWCGPCRAIAPLLDELASYYNGKLKICKVNVDDNKKIVAQYSIRGIPTLILFKNGVLQEQKVGALSKSSLKEFIDNHLTNTSS